MIRTHLSIALAVAAARRGHRVASRYERASLIVSSNKPFSVWTEIFGDAVAGAAMVDRLVRHAEIIGLKATPTGSRTAERRSPPNDQTVPISAVATCPDFGRR